MHAGDLAFHQDVKLGGPELLRETSLKREWGTSKRVFTSFASGCLRSTTWCEYTPQRLKPWCRRFWP